MGAREALQSGDVQQTLDLLKAEIRRAPRDARLRIFLFQMFCITGEWDRALTQLGVAGELDPAADAMVQAYGLAIRCEVLRGKVFGGTRSPTVLGEPGTWLPLLIEATRLLGTGQPDQAAQLRDQAFDQAPEQAVTIDGTEYGWIADADPRLGPVAEALIDGKYVWVPYSRIRTIVLEPPADLRDQVWMPARFTWSNGGEMMGFIPTRYPGTTASADPALLLARRTEFVEQGEWSIPIGQRMLVTDTADIALMDLRRLDAPTTPGAGLTPCPEFRAANACNRPCSTA